VSGWNVPTCPIDGAFCVIRGLRFGENYYSVIEILVKLAYLIEAGKRWRYSELPFGGSVPRGVIQEPRARASLQSLDKYTRGSLVYGRIWYEGDTFVEDAAVESKETFGKIFNIPWFRI